MAYYTHYQDPDFGLLQLGVRFYEPAVGRFGQRDRLGWDRGSAYCYAGSSSLRYIDPSGLVHIGSDINIDWNTGTVECACHINLTGMDIPDSLLPGIEIKPTLVRIRAKKPLSGTKCDKPKRCWPWTSDEEKRKNREMRKRRKAYGKCLEDACSVLCVNELPMFETDPSNARRQRELLYGWYDEIVSCFKQHCK